MLMTVKVRIFIRSGDVKNPSPDLFYIPNVEKLQLETDTSSDIGKKTDQRRPIQLGA